MLETKAFKINLNACNGIGQPKDECVCMCFCLVDSDIYCTYISRCNWHVALNSICQDEVSPKTCVFVCI